MDEGLGDEVGRFDVSEGAHIRGKEGEYSLKPPESSNKLESREMVKRGEVVCHESSFNMIADILEGKNLNRGANSLDSSEQQYGSPRSMDEAGNMVEELMVKNYDSSNVAIVSASNRGSIQAKQKQWQRLYQLGGGSASGSSLSNVMYKDHGQAISWEDARHVASPELLGQKSLSDDGNEVAEQLTDECKRVSENMISQGGIRTKIISKSGFSEFFVKNTLKGKGIIFKGPPHEAQRVELRDENNGKASAQNLVTSNALISPSVKSTTPSVVGTAVPKPGRSNHDGVTLREWLSSRGSKVNKVECLHIFKQIVDLVDYSHSQGVALHDLQPSHFYLLRSNQVKYLGSAFQRDDSVASAMHQDTPHADYNGKRRMPEQGYFPSVGVFTKKQKFGENMNYMSRWPQFTAKYNLKREISSDADVNTGRVVSYANEHLEHNLKTQYGIQDKSMSRQLSSFSQQQLTSVSGQFEDKWYASPEELNDGTCIVSSNIYSLGVLLFELLGCFDSERARAAAMLDLRHRILPPQFLSENPKEAGFCLWLLHPEPSSRPSTKEILQSELIQGLQEVSAEELSSSIEHEDTESELLSFFLSSVNEHKQKQASKLEEYIKCIDSDIEEVEKRHTARKSLATKTSLNSYFMDSKENTFQHDEPSKSAQCQFLPRDMSETRLTNNLAQIESAYIAMRANIQLAQGDATAREDKDLLRSSENLYISQVRREQNTTDSLGAFFDGLCKYARYTKFEVRGLLRNTDFNNSSNVICSLSFDRDLDYFAAAGVSKKIKIFEFNALLNESIDIHYPVIEMPNKSKLSCICWNNYIKNYLASTGYDGVVKLWDTSTGQGVFQYSEHEKRAWSVDFSQVCPTKLASGSDDCTVKLWNINEKNSLGTIRNIANVCCVQFSSHSSHLLAFGSADYRTYCYDLRHVRSPWCVLAGHNKAVSYVKFLDHETVVTASTDNSLKLWDLNKTSDNGLSTSACSLTLEGHTNEKNFVGLSVADGYIACGSETNEVYAYHRSLPMPITSHKFGSIDPISGKETDDDNGQFVSSVCWRGNSDMIIAANSTGSIKVLEMV